MYLCKMIAFCFLHIQQQRLFSVAAAETGLGLKGSFLTLSVRLLISAGLHVSVAPPSSFIRGHASISLTILSPILPPTHPPALSPPFLFSPGTGLICGLRVQRGIEGGRIGESWKEGGNMKGRSWREQERKGASRGGVGKREKTRVKQ